MIATKSNNILAVITKCYLCDPSLIHRWHILAPTTVEKAIRHTVDTFYNIENLDFYEVTNRGEFVGYFAIETTDFSYVNGFFIMPKYRDKTHKKLFIKTIKRHIKQFYIVVYDKNERANRFLKENKFIFVRQVNVKDLLANVYYLP